MANERASFITPDGLLEHWQGHRRLTRRVIDAFPDDQLFTFTLGGMRSFGALTQEILGMGAPMVAGVATDKWEWSMGQEPEPKAALLDQWDDSTSGSTSCGSRFLPSGSSRR